MGSNTEKSNIAIAILEKIKILWSTNNYFPNNKAILSSSQSCVQLGNVPHSLHSLQVQPQAKSNQLQQRLLFQQPTRTTAVIQGGYLSMIKTRTKVVHKNVSHGCNKILNSKRTKISLPLHDIQLILCDLKIYGFIMLVFNKKFIKIG